MSGNDRNRLQHMLEAATEALSFVRGEAASKVSVECKLSLPAVPWPTIIGIRNRLIHAYFAVDLEIVETIR